MQRSRELPTEIQQAFKNVDLALKTAGCKGWSQVYKVRSYHVPLDDQALKLMVKGFREFSPDHEPIWTCVGVQVLATDDMRVKIEVMAHVGE
jgi:enamine deaminase RidA (YjgF/YER057c/UK114 family)